MAYTNNNVVSQHMHEVTKEHTWMVIVDYTFSL